MVIIIKAKRWFDKTYGNTYHSVQVYKNGKLIGTQPMTYGYGDAYMQSAFDVMQRKGIFKKTGEKMKSGTDKDYYGFMMWQRENRKKLLVFVDDVPRMKDLDKDYTNKAKIKKVV